jgi:hypothetical protein
MSGTIQVQKANPQEIEVLRGPENWMRCEPRVLDAQSVEGLRRRHRGW